MHDCAKHGWRIRSYLVGASVHPCLALSCTVAWRKAADPPAGLRHSACQEPCTGRVAAAQSAPDEARRLASALSSRRVSRRGGNPATTRSSISPSERRFARACSCCRRPSRRTCWLWKIGRWNHAPWGCGCCSARRCQKSARDRYSAAVTLPVRSCRRRQYTTGCPRLRPKSESSHGQPPQGTPGAWSNCCRKPARSRRNQRRAGIPRRCSSSRPSARKIRRAESCSRRERPVSRCHSAAVFQNQPSRCGCCRVTLRVQYRHCPSSSAAVTLPVRSASRG